MKKELFVKTLEGEPLTDSENEDLSQDFLELFSQMKDEDPKQYLIFLHMYNEILLKVNENRTQS